MTSEYKVYSLSVHFRKKLLTEKCASKHANYVLHRHSDEDMDFIIKLCVDNNEVFKH